MRRFGYLITLFMAMALATTASFAQEGKLKVKATPPQAYVFVDGQAMDPSSRSIRLAAGKHTVVVVNYGYKISTQDVTIEAGKSTPLDVKLDAYGDKVSGPYGLVIIEGERRKPRCCSNGTTPGYFVGHVDEFNNDWWWHQDLLLPPGTHHLTVTHRGKTVWSGDVTVQADKKTIVDVPHLANGFVRDAPQRTVDWKRGEGLKDLPRFTAGMASTMVVVAPPTGSASVSPAQHQLRRSLRRSPGSRPIRWTPTSAASAPYSPVAARPCHRARPRRMISAP